MVFKGTDIHTIDAKGRIFVPSRFRDLGDAFVLFKWPFKKCLYAMTTEAFENFSANLRSNATYEETEWLDDALFAEADDVTADAQNRILIKAELRDYAGLTKDVAVVGKNDHVEFWDMENWRERQQEVAGKLNEAMIGNILSRNKRN